MLADYATTDSTNKVNALGLGWSVTGTPLPQQAVVVMFRVGWDEANRPHVATLWLVDEDGAEVVQPSPDGVRPVRLEVQFETGRPPGLPPGTPVMVPICLNVPGGMPLQPGRYEWRVAVDGAEREGWSRGFTVVQQ